MFFLFLQISIGFPLPLRESRVIILRQPLTQSINMYAQVIHIEAVNEKVVGKRALQLFHTPILKGQS